MTLRLLMFAEATSDFRRASVLVDRSLAEHVEWTRDLLSAQEETPDENSAASKRGVRVWLSEKGEPCDEAFLDVHHLDAIAKGLRKTGAFRLSRGKFDGEPGKDSAKMGRKVLDVADQIRKMHDVSAVLLIVDMDEQPERKGGLEQAREVASRGATVILGCPNESMEAWVLAAFQQESVPTQERRRALFSALTFDPCEEAHRLSHKEGGPRSAKGIVAALLPDAGSDLEALRKAPLELLLRRGRESGLSAFLSELEERLCPLARLRNKNAGRRGPGAPGAGPDAAVRIR